MGPRARRSASCPGPAPRLESALLPGSELLAAGFFLYSAPLTLVLASAKRVDLFEWSEEAEDFVLGRADIRCPMRGASTSSFESGALVSDAHRALIEGGLFIHPAQSEAGDLRLLNEANPLAFVFRAATRPSDERERESARRSTGELLRIHALRRRLARTRWSASSVAGERADGLNRRPA